MVAQLIIEAHYPLLVKDVEQNLFIDSHFKKIRRD